MSDVPILKAADSPGKDDNRDEGASLSSTTATGDDRVTVSFEAPVGVRLQVTIETFPEPGLPPTRRTVILAGSEGGSQLRRVLAWDWVCASIRRLGLDKVLFTLAIAFYVAIRLIGLEDWPIYFFVDEAVKMVMVEDFLRSGLRNYEGDFLPLYFQPDPTFDVTCTNVYLQVIPYLLFGKSVFVTRAVSALVSLLAAVWAGLILRDIFKIRYWWAGTMVLSITPVWLIHSRTVFGIVEMVAFYAGFLYCYFLYRYRAPIYLLPSLVLGAAAFYTYSPGQVLMVLTGLFLLVSDFRHHWANRRMALIGVGVLILLAVPYGVYRLAHAREIMDTLAMRGSYWVEPGLSLWERLGLSISDYLHALSPVYWYIPQERTDPYLTRHTMKGYGFLFTPTLPFLAWGLIRTVRRLRDSAHRALLAVFLISPSLAAVVGVGITRVLVFVLPAALLTALGLEACLNWLARRFSPTRLAIGLFSILGLVHGYMLGDALINGPFWFKSDYGIQEYGARQVFAAIREVWRTAPETHIVMSPTWATGADYVARFFLPADNPFKFEVGGIQSWMREVMPLDDSMLFVLPVGDYKLMVDSGKFTDIRVERILPYPDGSPAFYFVRFRYVDDIEAIIAAEREERRKLIETQITLDGQIVQVNYSYLDGGFIEEMFDGNSATVGRTAEANPCVVELIFPEPRPVSGVTFRVGLAEDVMTAYVFTDPAGEPQKFSVVKTDQESPISDVDLSFGMTISTGKLRLEVLDEHVPEPANVHVWDIILR